MEHAILCIEKMHWRELILSFALQAIRVDMDYISYGPHGRTAHSQHVILPVHYPVKPLGSDQWRK